MLPLNRLCALIHWINYCTHRFYCFCFYKLLMHLLQNLSDQDLVSVYKQASLLVTPSFMEGYGLVGLEALMVGTPVVASNIAVYREVYGDKVTYFDPSSPKDLIRVISNFHFSPLTSHFTYSRTWDDVARDISEVIHARSSSL